MENKKIQIVFETLDRGSTMSFGKYKGKKIAEILAKDTPYLVWLRIHTDTAFTKGINKEIDRRMLRLFEALKQARESGGYSKQNFFKEDY